jgi:hypothetical protein
MKTVFHTYTHTTNNKNSRDKQKNKFADDERKKNKQMNDNKMIKVILLIFSLEHSINNKQKTEKINK